MSIQTPVARESLLREARRHWGWVMADGVAGIVAGVIALTWPGITVLVLAVLLGVGLLFGGGAEFAAGLSAFPGTPGRGWTIVLGLLVVAGGVICLVSPATGLFTIAVGVAIWFFSSSINEFIAAFTLREGRVWNLVCGVLSLIAGFVVASQPGAGLSAAAFVAGLLFLVRGATQTALAVKLRRVADHG